MYDLQKNIDKILFVTKQRGLSVDQMLKRAELSPSIIANMKRGQKPSVDKIQAIADYFNCSVDYLLGRTDDPEIKFDYSNSIEIIIDGKKYRAYEER